MNWIHFCVVVVFFCCDQTVEKQIRGSGSRFFASNLKSGKKYIVTIIAYKGNKRSKVAETIFKTGRFTNNRLCNVWCKRRNSISFIRHILPSVGVLYPFPMDCVQTMKNGNKKSGIYSIYINNDRDKPIEVYCDMDTDGGGWLVKTVNEVQSKR